MAGDHDYDHDYDYEPADEYFDTALRGQFSSAFPVGDDSRQVLHEIRPAVARARRRRKAGQALIFSSAASLLVAAVALSVGDLIPDRGELVVAGPTGSEQVTETDDSTESAPTLRLPSPADIASAGTDVAETDEAATSDNEGEEDEAGSSSKGPVTTVAATSSSVSVSVTSTTGPTTTSSTQVSSTTAAPTTSVPQGTLLESACGDIVYRVLGGNTLELLEVLPAGSYQAEIKENHPLKIEVKFVGGGSPCEIEVEFKNGDLKTSIEPKE